MRTAFLILVSTILSTALSGQTGVAVKGDSVNTTYFILGTLSDYNGRFWSIKKINQVDRYISYEKPIIDYINELTESDLKSRITTLINTNSTTLEYETFSRDMSLKLNSYYDKDKHLNESQIKDPVAIYSFLQGKYYRYGSILNDSIYVFRFENFPNHFVCNDLLKKIGCKVYFKQIKEMPARNIYYFIPTQKLKRYFDMITEQKAKLDNSYIQHYLKFFVMTDEEYKENQKKLIEKEFLEIKTKL